MMRNTTGPLAATSPRPIISKAAVAASVGIGLLRTASVWAQDAVVADASGEPAVGVSVVTVSGVCRADSIAGLAAAPSPEIKDKLFQHRMYAIRNTMPAPTRTSSATRCGIRFATRLSNRCAGMRKACPCLAAHRPCKTWTLRHDPS
ncbi:hypothetical protein [Janthinobacterium sp. LB3P118]|uniref:hypothetical protein n=1 Tax=Janthinobacterium sp. LB3P118 TaxID=3424195 RepID=UPI003F28A47C